MFGILVSDAHSYVLTESTQRVPIRWGNSNLQINIDTSSNDNFPRKNVFCRGPFFDSLEDSVINSHCTDFAVTEINETLSQWNLVSPVKISNNPFSINKLSFSNDSRFFSPGVVAVTLQSYNPGDGIIKNGQIYINHLTHPGFCFTKSKTAMDCVYLGDVIAHELGHFAGLAHSEVRDSSMLFTSFRGQHTLHPDDVSGLRSIYATNLYGRIRGQVLGGNRVPVFGVHVQAISSKRGDVVAAAISQEDGSFTINGLDLNETYYIYTEPLRNLDSLPDAFRSAQSNFCPGSYVGSFFESCQSQSRGRPIPIRLSDNRKELDIGVVTIRCQLSLNSQYLDSILVSPEETRQGVQEFRSRPNKMLSSFVGYYPSSEKLLVSNVDPIKSDMIKLDLSSIDNIPAGSTLDMKILTTAIGSPLDFSVSVNGPFGTIVDPDRARDSNNRILVSKEAFTQKPIFQRTISYPLSTSPLLNDFEILFAPRGLKNEEERMAIPLPSKFVLKDRPYLVMFEIRKGSEILYFDSVNSFSDNLACLDAPFTFSVRANNVSSAAMAGQSEDRGEAQLTGASCGTIEPPQSGGGQGLLSFMVGLSLLFLLPKKIRLNS